MDLDPREDELRLIAERVGDARRLEMRRDVLLRQLTAEGKSMAALAKLASLTRGRVHQIVRATRQPRGRPRGRPRKQEAAE